MSLRDKPSLGFRKALGLATAFLLHPQLRRSERLAFARRTELLPIPRRPRHGIVESQLRQHRFQIVDVHSRGEPLAAARTFRAFILFAGFLIKFHAKLRRALEDVKEFSER